MADDFPESRVLQIWQDCPGRNDLATEEDGPIKVLYPGRINDDSGADFRDAVIATSRGRLTGDIEIHTRSSQWWAHRHHLDPRYNRVVLHVVYWRDMSKSVRLENGQEVPTLALESLLTQGNEMSHPPVVPVPCREIRETAKNTFLSGILDVAGEQRFQSRAAGFQTVASPEEAGQALYRGIMAALGYAKNQHPMMELACRMPLRRLESLTKAEAADVEHLITYQAMLMGTAGLLPSQRVRRRGDDANDWWDNRLEGRWTAAGHGIVMTEKDWHFFRVRPGNSPVRRIAAMSYLLLRYRSPGLRRGLMMKFDEAALEGGYRELEEAFVVEAGDCRSIDTEFGFANRKNGPALLGRERAADITINVLLPFAAAWGRANARPEMAEKAVNLYRKYPARATNTLERHMSRQLGIDGSQVNTAQRQQGLLHIFKAFCAVGGCPNCPVNKVVKAVS